MNKQLSLLVMLMLAFSTSFSQSSEKCFGESIEKKRIGVWLCYYDKAKTKLRKESNLKDGIKNGMEKTYYSSGKIESESRYKKGKIHGILVMYYKNGKVKYNGEFKKGKPVKTHNHFDKKGVLLKKKKFGNIKK